MTRIGCSVLNIRYNYPSRAGILHMPPGECCDMRACIALFERISKSVQKIETWAGGKRDAVYRRKNNEWTASLESDRG